ncbi:MAG: Mut7-C RNAse domain-containing protein [Candidatus Thorarchaeota archaeon]
MKRFTVDAMLGKLALWLRLTGHDTRYSTDMHDDELLQVSLDEGRILITSDAELFERAQNQSLESLLLRGPVDEGIAQVFVKYNIPPKIDPTKSRCSKCNGSLVTIKDADKELVKGLVFEQTFDCYEEFWLCKDCSSVFFQGGHWKNIELYMKKVSDLMQRMT